MSLDFFSQLENVDASLRNREFKLVTMRRSGGRFKHVEFHQNVQLNGWVYYSNIDEYNLIRVVGAFNDQHILLDPEEIDYGSDDDDVGEEDLELQYSIFNYNLLIDLSSVE